MKWDYTNFVIQEFVPESIYNRFGNRAQWFLRPEVPAFAQKIRDHFGLPVIVNNWHVGGMLQYRGFRPRDCKVGAKNSQHRLGNALDFHVKGLNVEEVKDEIIRHRNRKWPELTAMELNTDDWVHCDFRWNNETELYLFNG